MGHADSPIRHHNHQIPQAQLEARVPAHAQNDDLSLEVPSFEQIFDRVERLHSSSSPGEGAFAPEPRGGPSWTTSAFGETPERRLWACNAKFAGPARRTKRVPISASDEFPQRRAGAIKEALHPRTLASRIVILTNGFANRGRGANHA